MKAFLIDSDINPEKIHNLNLLRRDCEKIDESFIEIAKMCVNLNAYGSQLLYPMELEIADGDTSLALKDSEKISEFVKNKIN